MTAISKLQDMINKLTDGGERAVVLDWDHKKIHDKKAFTTHFENEVTNIGEMTVIAFNSPAVSRAHLTFTVQASHEADVFIYRDTSIDPDEGTEINAVNRNQCGPIGESLLTSIETVPVAGELTSFNESQAASANISTTSELDHLLLLGGEGPKAVGAGAVDKNEWIFNDGAQIAIVIVAATDDTAKHIIRLDWQEEG